MKTRINNIALNVFLLILSTSLSLIILEMSIRNFLPQFAPFQDIPIVEMQGVKLASRNYRGRQYDNTGEFNVSVSINKHGFRDAKDIKHIKIKDYGVVGDSFAFGWCVEESRRFSNLLQNKLGVDVYNIAIPTDISGYKQLMDYVKGMGVKIPHLIMAICMENDIRNYNTGRPLTVTKTKALKRNYTGKKVSTFLDSWKNRLTGCCATYRFIAYKIHSSPFLYRLALKLGFTIEAKDAVQKLVFNYVKNEVHSSVKYIKKITKPYPTLIVIIPSRALWFGGHEKEQSKIHDLFVYQLKKSGLRVVDLRPYFERNGNPLKYHFINNGHWNEEGHYLAAQVIADSLNTDPL